MLNLASRRHTPRLSRVKTRGGLEKMHRTIELIGKAIRAGSTYLPIRMHAAALATKARPKDYLGQVKEIYDDATRRWRYVNDPFGAELLTYGPEAMARYVLALDNRGVGLGKGAGDCDCISAAIGAELMSIGRPIRIGVTAPPMSPPGRRMSHVFAQAYVPNIGWVTVDPVLYPDKPFGSLTKHSRIAVFNLSGKLMGYAGNMA